MQLSFRNRKLQELVEKRSPRLAHVDRLCERIERLKSAPNLKTVMQTANCHPLQKNRQFDSPFFYALNVTHNWRLCFEVRNCAIEIVDFCDYH